jgi:hypothetical protein
MILKLMSGRNARDWAIMAGAMVGAGAAIMAASAIGNKTTDGPNWGEMLKDLLNTATGNGINMRCQSWDMPKTTIQVAKAKVYGLETTQVVGATQTNSITLTMYEDQNHLYYRLFTLWRDLGVSSKTYSMLDRKTIASDRGFILYLARSSGMPIMIFELFGVQPTDVTLDDPSSDAEFQKLTVKFKYDHYETF